MGKGGFAKRRRRRKRKFRPFPISIPGGGAKVGTVLTRNPPLFLSQQRPLHGGRIKKFHFAPFSRARMWREKERAFFPCGKVMHNGGTRKGGIFIPSIGLLFLSPPPFFAWVASRRRKTHNNFPSPLFFFLPPFSPQNAVWDSPIN